MGTDIELLLLQQLDRFYHKTHPDTLNNIVLPIISEQHKISLRFIEKFITRYCKEKNIFIKNGNRIINPYSEYRAQLKSYVKRRFDPFKRRQSSTKSNSSSESEESHIILYPCDMTKKKFFKTTIGQLNFFRWIIETGILAYIIKNYDSIKQEC